MSEDYVGLLFRLGKVAVFVTGTHYTTLHLQSAGKEGSAAMAVAFGTISASLSLTNITYGKLIELATRVISFRQLCKDTSKAVEKTQKAIELLTKLQNDGHSASIGSFVIERVNDNMMEINTELEKLVQKSMILIFLNANTLLCKIDKTLAKIEDFHKHLENLEMYSKYNETTVDTVLDLTQGLAREDVQHEMNGRLMELQQTMVEIASSARCDIRLQPGTIHTCDFQYRISQAKQLLCAKNSCSRYPYYMIEVALASEFY